MKILLVTQRYWPENFRITNIVEQLAHLGHDVTILTGLPNYPKGYVLPEYKKGKNRIQNHKGVKIIRSNEIGRRNNILFRFLNYYSFPFFANKKIRKLDNDFDVVLINELSPIMAAYPALKYAKKHNKKVVMYEMDLWPESLLAGGIKKDSFIYNHYKKVSSNIYSKCDLILTSTKEHIDYIKELPKCNNLNIEYLPQYSEDIFDDIKPKTNKDRFILTFAGNVGKAQDVDVILNAADILKDNKDIEFHIVGNGSEKDRLETKAKELNLSNVIFYGVRPLNEMPKFYEESDAMLVTLEDKPYANFTLPGKVQTYLAAGRPIISCANGSTFNFINENKCGIACNSGDYKALADAVLKLKEEPNIQDIGIRCKTISKNLFSKDKFIKTLIDRLQQNCD